MLRCQILASCSNGIWSNGHKGHTFLIVCSELCSAAATLQRHRLALFSTVLVIWSDEQLHIISTIWGFHWEMWLRSAMQHSSWVQSNFGIPQGWYVQWHASAVTTAANSACTAFQPACTVCGSAGCLQARDQLCNVIMRHLCTKTASRKRLNLPSCEYKHDSAQHCWLCSWHPALDSLSQNSHYSFTSYQNCIIMMLFMIVECSMYTHPQTVCFHTGFADFACTHKHCRSRQHVWNNPTISFLVNVHHS